jgi:CO/xanthine dehydrogenase FAD-binding subunit
MVEATAQGLTPDPQIFNGLGRLAAESVAPADEERVPAAFRRELVATLTARALSAAVQKAGSPP